MNEHDVISRLSALPDDDVTVHVDVDTVIASVKVQRRRRRAVAATALATAALVGGLIVATGQLDRDTATPAAQPGTWSVHSPGIKGASLSAVAAISQSDAWAVGYLRQPRLTGLATHWDGKKWTRYVLPKDYVLSDVAAVAPDDVWSVGYIKIPQGSDSYVSKPLAMHWDGHSWREVPVPAGGTGQSLTAVVAISANDVWAVGDVSWLGPEADHPYIVHWDGREWTVVTTPAVPGVKGMFLRGISATGANDIWVAGMSDAAGEWPLTLHWDGRQWSTVPVSEQSDDLTEIVAVAPHEVWAVGRERIYRWDGNRWQTVTVPEQAAGHYLTIAPDGAGGILVAGALSQKCPAAPCVKKPEDPRRVRVAHWNGTEWALITPPADASGFIQDLDTTPGSGVIWAVGTLVEADINDAAPIVALISFSR